MDISVGKDRKMGDTQVLSAAHPEELSQRGVKVYDEAQRVVYQVSSRAIPTLENGVQPWSCAEAEPLTQRVGPPLATRPGVTLTRADPAAAGGQSAARRANLGVALGSGRKGAPAQPGEGHGDWAPGPPQAPAEMAVPGAYVGERTPVLEFDGTVQGDVFLIDEDDDRSLREKTVTDMSMTDGHAAELVAGPPVTASSELPSEDQEESAAIALPPPRPKKKRCRCRCCTVM